VSAYQIVATPTGTYQPAPSVDLSSPTGTAQFVPDEYEFVNESATACMLSFDGINDHARVPVPTNGAMPSMRRLTRVQKVWIKGAGNIRVMAWTHR
jgi:hypothetical protein